jgi:HSP20 family protein
MTEKKQTKSLPTKANTDDNLTVRSTTGLASIFDGLFGPFDELFQPGFPSSTQSLLSELSSARQPILDIQDRGDHFSLTAELPGFTKDEVQVKVDSNSLELRAEKTLKEGKEESGTYKRSSRSYYQYLSLPDEVSAGKIEGTMKNGILELKIPKRASKLKDAAHRVDLK